MRDMAPVLPLVLLLVGTVFLWTCIHSDTHGLDAPCAADLKHGDRQVDIEDITSFLAPVRRLDTYPGHPNFDAQWDVVPGPMVVDGQAWITVQDMSYVIIRQGWCDSQIRFLSKLTDADDQFRQNPAAFAAMMNQNYEAVMTFDCGICRDFGNAFVGTAYVYQDPTKILTNCSGEQPGTDCSDILLTTGGQRCWQRFFNGTRYLADVTQADVRDEIVAKAQALEAEGTFDGIYIDVAEAHLPNAHECPGTPAVTNAAWLAAWATLAERLQDEVPGPLILNSQYFTWNSLKATNLADANRFWSGPDAIETEFGWAYGRHGESTVSGAADKLAYVDHLHALKTAVFDQDYDDGNADFPVQLRDFGLAMYLIQRGPADFYGTFNQDGHGSQFHYTADYGEPIGARQSCGSGCYSRQYELGTVTANVISKTAVLP